MRSDVQSAQYEAGAGKNLQDVKHRWVEPTRSLVLLRGDEWRYAHGVTRSGTDVKIALSGADPTQALRRRTVYAVHGQRAT